MWKKEEPAEPMAAPRPAPPPSIDHYTPRNAPGDRATIGRSITIKGEVKGDEDLLIQGRVEGSVTLKQHSVTVGPEGEVKADISARVISVEGMVEGNLTAQEQILLRGSARLQGNIAAPRVVLEDGARFRGSVDMGEMPAEATSHDKFAQRTEAGTAKLPSDSSLSSVKDSAAQKVASLPS